jgi:hypothetical protein
MAAQVKGEWQSSGVNQPVLGDADLPIGLLQPLGVFIDGTQADDFDGDIRNAFQLGVAARVFALALDVSGATGPERIE